MYDFVNDLSGLHQGVLTIEHILKFTTQEDIFSLVFKEIPQLGELYCSPFRPDNSPNCWFSYSPEGKLIFVDFGCTEVKYGIKLSHIDCFNAVQLHFNYPDLKSALLHIKTELLNNRIKIAENVKRATQKKSKESFAIRLFKKEFTLADQYFWQSYGISRQNLLDDEVSSLKAFTSLYPNGKIVSYTFRNLAYGYSEWENGHKKLYMPNATSKEMKFYTNCVSDDIGGYKSLSPMGRTLVITKGYKDYRVLKNLGYNVVWFQSESMFPCEELLEKRLVNRFTDVVIWFDNDTQGLRGSEQLQDTINSIRAGKARRVWHTDYKDPSDFRKADFESFKQFCNNYV